MDADLRFFMQPLYAKGADKEIPIYHRKDLIFKATSKAGKVEYRMFTSTFNWQDHDRVNDMLETRDADLCEYMIKQTVATHVAFGAGKDIKAIDTPGPYRLVAQDKSFVEAAFTDDKANPNDRIGVGARAKFGQAPPPLPKVYASDPEGKPSGILNRVSASPRGPCSACCP